MIGAGAGRPLGYGVRYRIALIIGSAGGFCKLTPLMASWRNCSSTRRATCRLVTRFLFGRPTPRAVGLFGLTAVVFDGISVLERVLRGSAAGAAVGGAAGTGRAGGPGGLCGTSCVALMGVLFRVLRWWTRLAVRSFAGWVGSAVVPVAPTLGSPRVSTLGGPWSFTLGGSRSFKILLRSRSILTWRTFCAAVSGGDAFSSRSSSVAACIVRSPSEIVGILQCAGKIW